MIESPKPSEANSFLAEHVATLRSSFRHWLRRDLVAPRMNDEEAARYVFHAPFVLVSHGTEKDPIFNYGNLTALDLFGVSWEEFTALPSRLSVESVNQAERTRLLEEVSTRGFLENYRGVRVGRHGARFLIESAIVWNLLNPSGACCGQAAMFQRWRHL
ncbi:MAG: MEKHLA domain-containing protein [Chromatiales bacterium]|nr:MEKHLA domain-containing protein [Chromatiales bacterium]